MKSSLLRWVSIFIILFITLILHLPLCSQKNSDFEEILTQAVLLQRDSCRGTGFIYNYNSYLYLVTARHVLFHKDKCASPELLVTAYPEGSVCNRPSRFKINLEMAEEKGRLQVATSHDFMFIEMGKFVGLKRYLASFVVKIDSPFVSPKYFPSGAFTNLDSIGVGEVVYLFGYPVSLSVAKQFDFNRPIMRTGTISARSCTSQGSRHTDYSVLIDARVDKGMSGGFGMIKTDEGKYSLIGLIVELVPWIKEVEKIEGDVKITEYENSGLSILLSMDTVFSAIDRYQKLRKQ